MQVVDLTKEEEVVLNPNWQKNLAREVRALKGFVTRMRSGPAKWTKDGNLERSLLDELESCEWIGRTLLRAPCSAENLALELYLLDFRYEAIVVATLDYLATHERREYEEG